jgi:oligopeptide/dipeptide ABC transporter ATP-binding protein
VRLHQHTSRRETLERTVEALRLVGIADPERRVNDYPHQLSGGMRQRVMIAMALACKPKLLIADEPTTALDVTIQAQILDLIRELQVRLGLAVILVTHDLGIVAQYADDVTILYAARVMEQAASDELFRNPLNPYTRGLLESIPGIDGHHHRRLRAIAGTIPSALRPPSGCRFHPRCPMVIDECSRVDPPLEAKAPQHLVACIRV